MRQDKRRRAADACRAMSTAPAARRPRPRGQVLTRQNSLTPLCGWVAGAQLQLQMFKEHMDLESQPGPDVTFGVPEGAETYAGWLEGAARCATGEEQLVSPFCSRQRSPIPPSCPARAAKCALYLNGARWRERRGGRDIIQAGVSIPQTVTTAFKSNRWTWYDFCRRKRRAVQAAWGMVSDADTHACKCVHAR